LGLLGVIAFGIGTGCAGGASVAGKSSAATPLTSAELKAIDAKVGVLEKRPTELGITQPVQGIPKGKTFYFIYGRNPGAIQLAGWTQEAVTTAGWTYKGVIVPAMTPQGFQAAFDIALQGNPSVIVSLTINPSDIAPEVAQATQRHIPIIIEGAPTALSGGTTTVMSVPALETGGALQADAALFQTHGNAHVMIASTSAIPSVATLAQAFVEEWKKMCAKCATPLIYNAPVASFGTNFPSLVSAFLLAHPQVDFVDWGFSEMLNGIPNALKAAGLASPKGTTLDLAPTGSELLLSNNIVQSIVGYPDPEMAWLGVDTAIRLFDHQSVSEDMSFAGPGSPDQWIVTSSALKASGLDINTKFPLDPDYKAQFMKLWGLK
jgi:ABC-type sugar transport system substrate-binding protein